MDEPTSYPTWRFWRDGSTVIVDSPAALRALRPGHAGSPGGPFPREEPEHDEEPAPEDLPESEEPAEEVSETAALQDQARDLLAQGYTVAQIARAVQRSPRTVGRWLQGVV